MKSFEIIIIVAIIAAAAGSTYIISNHDQQQDAITILTADDSYFYTNIKGRATDVENAVIAVTKGQENPGNAMSLIATEYTHSTHDTEYSQDERAINENYKNYLNVAYGISRNYTSNQSKEQIDRDMDNLTAAKELI